MKIWRSISYFLNVDRSDSCYSLFFEEDRRMGGDWSGRGEVELEVRHRVMPKGFIL